MRSLIPMLVLGICAPTGAQTPYAVTPPKPDRAIRSVMEGELTDPVVQVAIGVTSTQRQLQSSRIAEESLKMALGMVRATLQQDENAKPTNFSLAFSTSSGKALYPFLNEAQIAKLRRLTLRDYPLASLATDEVAFVVELTAAQRAKIDALQARVAQATLSPTRPSMRLLTNALKEIAAANAKLDTGDSSEPMTVERLDEMRPILEKLFRAIEASIRLGDKEKVPTGPSPLTLLIPKQRKKYEELSAVGSKDAEKTRDRL